MKIYISGPMTGLPEFNKHAFNAAAAELRKRGYEVANPVENGVPETAPWETHMKADIKMLMDCDAVAILPGADESRGATEEVRIARILGLLCKSYARWL